MEINIKNIELFKDGNWIYIKTGEYNGKATGIKLLYDDNAFANPAKVYKQELDKLQNNNFADRIDDLLGTIDLGASIAENAVKVKMSIEGKDMEISKSAADYLVSMAGTAASNSLLYLAMKEEAQKGNYLL